MPERKDEVAPPPRDGEWRIRYGANDVVDGWGALECEAPERLRWVWEQLRHNPRDRTNRRRQHRLEHNLSSRIVDGKELEQWQIEVTGSGRVWYVIDDEAKTVWVTLAATGHPGATDRGKGRGKGTSRRR